MGGGRARNAVALRRYGGPLRAPEAARWCLHCARVSRCSSAADRGSDTHPPPYDRLESILRNATLQDEEPAYAYALNVLLTNWAVNGHETWIQAGDGTFKELFLELGRALRHDNDQQTWVRINATTALLYEHFVRGPLPEDDQRALAYLLWEERSRPLGSPEHDWYRAGKIIRHWRWKFFLKETRQ